MWRYMKQTKSKRNYNFKMKKFSVKSVLFAANFIKWIVLQFCYEVRRSSKCLFWLIAGSNCEWKKSVRIDRPYLPEHNVQVNRVAFYLPEKGRGKLFKVGSTRSKAIWSRTGGGNAYSQAEKESSELSWFIFNSLALNWLNQLTFHLSCDLGSEAL